MVCSPGEAPLPPEGDEEPCTENCTFPDHKVEVVGEMMACARGGGEHVVHVCADCFSPRMHYAVYDKTALGASHHEDARLPFTEAHATAVGPLRLGVNTHGPRDRAHVFHREPAAGATRPAR